MHRTGDRVVRLEVEVILRGEEVEARAMVAKEHTTHLEARAEGTLTSLRMAVDVMSRSTVSSINNRRNKVTSTSTKAMVRFKVRVRVGAKAKVEVIHSHSSTDSKAAARVDTSEHLQPSQSLLQNWIIPTRLCIAATP